MDGRLSSVRPIDGRLIEDPPIDVRPADSPALPDSDLPDSEDDRGVIVENFCQPPLLPFARPAIDPLELPDLDADPRFELPLASDDLPFNAALVLPRLAPCPWVEKKC